MMTARAWTILVTALMACVSGGIAADDAAKISQG
jgi:hypothetical protein